jgi:rubrerythrin
MGNITASAIISFTEELEDRSAAFYTDLAERFPKDAEVFLSIAGNCEKIKKMVIRTYRETVSDALETGFSFDGLKLISYDSELTLDSDEFGETLEKAIALEKKAAGFYEEVARRSRSLLATIAMAFKNADKRRKQNLQKLELLID